MTHHTIDKKYILPSIASMIIIGFLAITLLYSFNSTFREATDDTYNAAYSNLYINPKMNRVAEVIRNLPYCRTNNNLQKLDIYTPKQSEIPHPTIVYIHGGGWSNGDKANPFVIEYGSEIVRNNMAFISINYRLAPNAIYPAQNQDVDCALGYIISHAHDLNVDPSKLALMGDSAGAELAAMAALTSPSKSFVRAVIDCYGPSDVWAQITRKPRIDQWGKQYIGSATNETLSKQASPLYANLHSAPPFLIVHGTNDMTVHFDQSTNFVTKLQAAGNKVTLVPVQNANHYFSDKSQPNVTEIKATIIKFLKAHL